MGIAFKNAMDNINKKKEPRCNHKFEKTISKNGMHFILLCHKCMAQKPYAEPQECDKK